MLSKIDAVGPYPNLDKLGIGKLIELTDMYMLWCVFSAFPRVYFLPNTYSVSVTLIDEQHKIDCSFVLQKIQGWKAECFASFFHSVSIEVVTFSTEIFLQRGHISILVIIKGIYLSFCKI